MQDKQLPVPIELTACPHPFTSERYKFKLSEGGTLAEVIDKSPLRFRGPIDARITVNGVIVPCTEWFKMCPVEGDIITLNIVPMGEGGDDKDPLRTILIIAIVAAAITTGGWAAGGLGFAQGTFGFAFTSGLVAGIISYAGLQLLNDIMPIDDQDDDTGTDSKTNRASQMYSIEGASNRIALFGPIPQVLGRHRMMAYYAAKPFTEIVGKDMYLRCLFTFGYGPLNISSLKLGETLLSEYNDVEYNIFENYDPDNDVLELVTQNIDEDTINALVVKGSPVTRTILGADEFSLDLTAPQGIYNLNTSSGKFSTLLVKMSVQYKSTASGSEWSNAEDVFSSVGAQTRTLSNNFGNVSPGVSPARRTFTVAFDKFDGSIRITKSNISYAERVAKGYGVYENIPRSFPGPPKPHRGCWPLAYVYTTVTAVFKIETMSINSITDVRDEVLTFAGTANDFEVTDAGASSGRDIDIAAGTIKFWAGFNTNKQGMLRQGFIVKLPAQDDYDIRVKRVTPQYTVGSKRRISQDVYLTKLRTITYEAPLTKGGLALVELRIKATDQLNGAIQNFNAVVQSVVQSYDLSSADEGWGLQPTSSPADLFRYVFQGAPNKRPATDGEMDLVTLQTWAQFCDDNGLEFNQVIDREKSVDQIARSICSAGRASLTMKDGKFSVIIDTTRSIPIQHFTPRNTWGFQGAKTYFTAPHAFRVRFTNKENDLYRSDEVFVYDDGYTAANATLFETLELPGVTNYAQAYKAGRYHMAALKLRPEMFSFHCDIENLVCTRGDLVHFNQDVIAVGTGYG
ncbi:hypothetical protein LCGC14_1443950, partial [marine sediment metagenome]